MAKRKRKSQPSPKGQPSARTQTRSRRSGILVAGVLGLAVVVGVATWFVFRETSPQIVAAQYQGGPRLAVDTDLIDFGNVRFEKFVKARFRLRNVGDKPLRLPAYPPVDVVEGC